MDESSRRKSSQRKSSRNIEDTRTNDRRLPHPSRLSKGGSHNARGNSNSPRRPNTKQTGERSEAAFLHRASALGFGVAKPWGDSLRYDFILDNGERLWRIQIKCTESIRAQAYADFDGEDVPDVEGDDMGSNEVGVVGSVDGAAFADGVSGAGFVRKLGPWIPTFCKERKRWPHPADSAEAGADGVEGNPPFASLSTQEAAANNLWYRC